jgi:hypothetical protein
MAIKRYKAEQIVILLRQIEVNIGNGNHCSLRTEPTRRLLRHCEFQRRFRLVRRRPRLSVERDET